MISITNKRLLKLIYGNKKNQDLKKIRSKSESNVNFEKTIDKLKMINSRIEKNTRKHISNLDREIYSLKKKLNFLNSKLEKYKITNNNFFNF